MFADAALILGAYLLGSVPHLSLLAKLRHTDLDGDFHQSLWNRAGKVTGIIGVLGEFAKGFIPVLLGKYLDFCLITTSIAGVAAVCGQMWPVFSKFDGEKGNSIALAMVIALAPRPALVTLVIAAISVIIRTSTRFLAKSPVRQPVVGGPYSRSLPLGMFIGFFILPFVAWYFDEPPEIIWCFVALFVLMIMIRRLTAGITADLKAGNDIKGILLKRLFYDRATAVWRQETRSHK
jgi:glycerol-3-phosphate acyltransferase PlsY